MLPAQGVVATGATPPGQRVGDRHPV